MEWTSSSTWCSSARSRVRRISSRSSAPRPRRTCWRAKWSEEGAIMNTLRIIGVAVVSLSCALPLAEAQSAPARRDTTPVPPLFQSTAPLAVTFTADLRRLKADKETSAPWRGATIAYTSDTGRISIPVRARTRGIWRLKNCMFPPLRLEFHGKDAKGTVFQHLGKPKLVNYCRDTDPYEQYVLQEFQLYRVYQLLTPMSYRVRLLRMAYMDSGSSKPEATRYAFIAEDPERLAQRFDGTVVKAKGATADDLDPQPLALAYLFQFLIGNTDFSFNGLHNTQLIGTNDGRVLPVAYDFDFTGAVNATYAVPDATLKIRNVRTRKFRGYCT